MDASRELNAESILGVDDQVIEKVETPEWGAGSFVYVRRLTGLERDEFEDSCVSGAGKDRKVSLRNLRARLLVKALCRADGSRLFTDAQAIQLGCKSGAVLDRLFAVAQRLSGLSQDDVKALEKNSEATPQDCDNCA